MSKCLRLLALAAVFSGGASGVAFAQTVLLRGAPAGDAVEVVINGATVATGTVAADGLASLAGTMPLNDANRAEMDARVVVDVCPKLYRVQIFERNRPLPVRAEGCERREIGGVFWLQQRSTLVIDVAGAIPTMLLRQGEYDPNAVYRGRQAPRGLVLFAGGGWGTFEDVDLAACGNVGECDGKGSGGAWTAGATLWVTRFLGVEGAYLKPRKASFEASAVNFRFTHFFDAELFTVSGKLAAPIGPVRLYGKGGAAFHRSVTSTTQTNDPLTYTSEGVTYTQPGGTQTLESRTDGWSWLAGGGIEGWVSPRFGLYAEADFSKLKGEPTAGTDIPLDNRLLSAVVGIRLRIF